MTKLRLNRDSGYADRIRDYHVVLDGKKVARIGNGESIEIPVEPGKHELYMKIDWCRSNKIEFEAQDGQENEFYCGSSLRGFKLIFSIVYATFLKNSYLWLKESSNKSLKNGTR